MDRGTGISTLMEQVVGHVSGRVNQRLLAALQCIGQLRQQLENAHLNLAAVRQLLTLGKLEFELVGIQSELKDWTGAESAAHRGEIDLADLLRRWCEGHRADAERGGVALHLESPEHCFTAVRRSRIQLLFEAILQQAFHATAPGGEILVTLVDRGDAWDLEVADSRARGIKSPPRNDPHDRCTADASACEFATPRSSSPRHDGDGADPIERRAGGGEEWALVCGLAEQLGAEVSLRNCPQGGVAVCFSVQRGRLVAAA
jgi:hypothetical protein